MSEEQHKKIVKDRKITTARTFKYESAEQLEQWHRAFLECKDVTGFVFAEEWVEGGFRQWQKLIRTAIVKKYADKWLEELEIAIQSAGIRSVIALGISGDGPSARWMAARGWIPKEDKKSKEAKKRAAIAEEEVQKDFKRLGLQLVVNNDAKAQTSA